MITIWRPHDGRTYWCHGYTFGGHNALGGPYSVWGQTVPTILKDEWKRQHCCMTSPGDILVFYQGNGVSHTGIIQKTVSKGGKVDESASQLRSKWGMNSLNTSSWKNNASSYGKYECYTKKEALQGCCNPGDNERK